MANKLSRMMSRPTKPRQQAPIGGDDRKLRIEDKTRPFTPPPSHIADWRVVMIAPNQEARATDSLTRAGWLVWRPQITVWLTSARLRMKTKVNRPLFPRYILVAPNGATGSILGIPEVSSIVGEIRPHVVMMLAAREMRGEFDATLEPDPEKVAAEVAERAKAFGPGKGVTISEGPLAGLNGIVARSDAERVAVLMEILGSQREVEIPVAHLRLAG